MNKLKLVAFMAVLGLTLGSCTKEVVDDASIVTAPSSVTYFINGEQHYANPQTEEEWSDFLDRMFALAKEGNVVRFERSTAGGQGCVTKEKETFTTNDFTKAKAWAFQKELEGYVVTITYDQQSGEYTCIAIR